MSDERRNLPSASAFETDVECNGRQNLIRSMPPVVEIEPAADDVALRGTRIHEARASGNTLHLRDEGELEAYNTWCRLEWSVIADWQHSNGITHYSEGVSEERLWLHHPQLLTPLLSGQLDTYYIAGQHALIADGKTGTASYVKAANASWQLRIYALLLWKEFPQLTRIRCAFIKPEVTFGAQVDTCDFTLFDLRQIEAEVYRVLWATQQPDAQLHAGPHCRWCRAQSVCPEAARYSMLPEVLRHDDPVALVSLMPIETALLVWQKAGIIEKIIAAITGRLKALPPEELERLGLALTAGKKSDFIRDTRGVFELLESQGVDKDALFSALSFGKDKLIEVLRVQMGMGKRQAESYFETELDGFIERARNKPSLIEK